MTDLQINQQAIEHREAHLTIVVPEERVEKAMRATAARLSRQLRFPGFRPGKVPYHIILQRVGREALLQEVAEDLAEEVFKEMLAATELEPFAPSKIIDVTFDPLTYHVNMPLAPEVNLGDYRNLRVDFPTPPAEEVEARVQKELSELQKDFSTWVEVDRPVAYGDMITVKMKLTVDDEVVLENDDWDIAPDQEDYTLAPEFDAAFIDMTTGEAKTFTVHFPDDSDSAWAGKEGTFEVFVSSVRSEEPHALDDDFAKETGDFGSVAELLQSIEENILTTLMDRAEDEFAANVFNALFAQSTIDYPPAAVEIEIDLLSDEQERFYRRLGIESKKELLRLTGKTMDVYREELRPQAERRLQRDLILNAVAEQEQLRASDYELDQYLSEALDNNPEQLDKMQKQLRVSEDYRRYIAQFVIADKARYLLLAIARGEDIPPPGEHPVQEAPPEPEPTMADEIATDEPTTTIAEPETEPSDETIA